MRAIVVVTAFDRFAFDRWIAASVRWAFAEGAMRIDGALSIHTARRWRIAWIAALRIETGGRIGTIRIDETFFGISAASCHRIADQTVWTRANECAGLIRALGRTVARSIQALVDILTFTIDQNVARRARACGFVTFNDARTTTAIGVIAWICNEDNKLVTTHPFI